MAKRIDDSSAAVRSDASAATRNDDLSISGVLELVKSYAKQETLGPLRGAGRWLAMGVAGAILLGVGLTLLLLGLLRLIQTEWDRAARGSLSWLSYLIVLVACAIGIAFAVSRIRKTSLNKERD